MAALTRRADGSFRAVFNYTLWAASPVFDQLGHSPTDVSTFSTFRAY